MGCLGSPIPIPLEQFSVDSGHGLSIGRNFSVLPFRMAGVALPVESAAPCRSLIEYPVSARIWRTVRDTVLNHGYVDSGPERLVQRLPPCALHNFFDREVGCSRMFAMKKCSRNPNFIGNLDLAKNG